jgi:hypothetical protein
MFTIAGLSRIFVVFEIIEIIETIVAPMAAAYFKRRHGRVARQRSAKPSTAVRIRLSPHIFL